MAINERLIHTAAEAAEATGTGNQQEGLILHLDANDVDSYDGGGSTWYDITNHEYTPSTNVSEHFNTVLYSATTNSLPVTGVGFQPDLIWLKSRDNSYHHSLYDSVRGAGGYAMQSSSKIPASNTAGINGLTSFDSDGFTLAAKTASVSDNSNFTAGSDAVAWCFKAGGAPTVSNPYMIDGTGYSTLSAAGLADDGDLDLNKASINTKLGFGIYNFDPNNVSGETASFEHGLGATPELVITKSVSGTFHWWTFTNQIDGSWDYLKLNDTDAKSNDTITSGAFADATTMRFAYGFTGNSSDHIAYAFTSKRGVSKVGSYEGSSSSVEVNTGFKPAFVMIKNADVAGDPWVMLDAKRPGDSGVRSYLYPSDNYAESTGGGNRTGITFNANGFSLDDADSHSVNENGKTFVYLAIAEKNPDTLATRSDFTEGTVTSGPEIELKANNYSGSGNWLNTGDGSGMDGTITGATYTNDSDSDYFSFDGSNDKISLGTSATKQLPMTVEAWLNPTTTNNATYYSNYDGSAVKGFYMRVQSDGTFLVDAYNGSGSNRTLLNNTSGSIKDNVWSHVVVTFSTSKVKLYVDGTLTDEVSTHSNGIGFTSSFDTTLGVRGTNSDWYQGKIAQVRVYDSELSHSDIYTNYNATKGLYKYGNLELHLDPASYSGSGTTWTADVGNDGTITGASYDQELGDWFNFDGNDKVTISHDSGYDLSTAFTVECWVNRADNTERYIFTKQGGSGSYGWFLQYHPNSAYGYSFGIYTTANSHYTAKTTTSGAANTNEWTHLVGVIDGSNMHLYQNGELMQTTAISGTLSDSDSADLRMGVYANDTGFWNGKIGQARIYQSALAADEVMQNYQFTKNEYTNGYNGTISSATWDDGSSETDTPGYFSFNGSASVTTTLDLTSGYITTDGGYTLLAWFRLASSPNALNAIFGDANIVFGVGGGDVTGSYSDESLWLYQSSPYVSHWGREGQGVYADQEWHHIALTVIGTSTSNKLFYVDGALESMTAQAGQSEPWAFTDLRIGNTGTSSSYNLKGDIAEVKVFDRVLPLSEIKAEFNLRCEEFGLTKLT